MTEKQDRCPYNCKDGKYFDVVSRSMVVCPHCSAKRKAEVRSGMTEDGESISKLLGFESEYTSTRLDVDDLLTPSQVPLLRRDSVDRLRKAVEEVYANLTLGNKPTESMCFGLDRGLRAEAIVIPFLLTAYKSGLSVAPFISAPDYRARMFREEIESRENAGVSVMRELYLNQDVVIMLIPSGIGEADILEAKGLMQARAAKGKATLFITSRPREFMGEIVRLKDDPKSLYYARGEFVAYEAQEGRGSGEGIDRTKMVPHRSGGMASGGGMGMGSAKITMADLRAS